MRVLFLTHRLPYAPNRGDRIRAYHIVRSLASSFDVDVVSLAHDDFEMAQAGRLRELGVRVEAVRAPRLANYAKAAFRLGGTSPLTHLLLDSPAFGDVVRRVIREHPPDVVLAYCSGMAKFALETPLRDFPLLVDLVDVDSEKWSALAESSSTVRRWIYQREARLLRAFERQLGRAARATLVINDRERDAFQAIAPEAQVVTVSNGLELTPLVPSTPPEQRPRLVFCGVMNYTPNVDAVTWFVRDVWPIIRSHRPDAHFTVVGSEPVSSVRRLHSPVLGIEVTGAVDDVRPYLWSAAVGVAPLITARGIQNKVLEAIGAGLPAVVSVPVFEGLPSEVRPACRVAASADSFAASVLELLRLEPWQRRDVAASADLHSLSWESQLRPLHDLLSSAANEQRQLRAEAPGPSELLFSRYSPRTSA